MKIEFLKHIIKRIINVKSKKLQTLNAKSKKTQYYSNINIHFKNNTLIGFNITIPNKKEYHYPWLKFRKWYFERINSQRYCLNYADGEVWIDRNEIQNIDIFITSKRNSI